MGVSGSDLGSQGTWQINHYQEDFLSVKGIQCLIMTQGRHKCGNNGLPLCVVCLLMALLAASSFVVNKACQRKYVQACSTCLRVLTEPSKF